MDVLDDPRHVGLELLAGHVRLPVDLGPRRDCGLGGRHRLLEPLLDPGDRLRRPRVGRLDAALVLDERVDDQRHLVALVVEGDEHVADHQRHVGQPERVGVRLAERRLDRADEVVAEDADGAAGERRQRLGLGDRVAAEVVGDGAVGIGDLACPGRARRRGRRRRPTRSARPRSSAGSRGGGSPRKDQRPRRPCSADSSRKDGPSPRSFRKALTGRLDVVDEGVADGDDVGVARELAGALEARLEGEPCRLRRSLARRPFRTSITSAIETPRESSSTARW